ncbi:uncharacterized protein DUF695 [Novosphingobium sp. PhB165]|nr:uncharacterized protein DUF695 [Novosphingobium sp. PhB165]
MPQAAQAEADNAGTDDTWMVYDRAGVNGHPLVVVARTGNAEAESLLREGLVTGVSCRAAAGNVNENGMPQGTDRIYALEDRLLGARTLVEAGGMHVASVTGDGQRRMFYVHRDPVDLGAIVSAMPVAGFACDVCAVTDRQSLIALVTPTALERQLNGDQSVIASLQKQGDDGHAPRKTNFWFYGDKQSLASLSVYLKPRGFTVDHTLKDPAGVVLSREMAVDLTEFRSITPVLVDAVGRFGVEYDGWETFVVRPISAP